MNNEINGKYDEYVKKLNKKRRVNFRAITEQGISKADPDIINEEDFEVNYIESEYNNYLDKKEKEKDPENFKSPLYDGKTVYLKDEKNKK